MVSVSAPDAPHRLAGHPEKERSMPGTVQEFFETLPSEADTSKTEGMNNSYAFDIEGAGQWTVKVEEGSVRVVEGAEEADVTISASQEVFQKIIAGEQNPTSAYMTGKLKLKGDMGAAMKLQKLFPNR
jgi:putative sterol carrier protein